jgi:hypothetical protein
VTDKPKYYVYLLIDPRTDRPFYVGKGCRDRMYQHRAEATAYRKTGVCINEIKCLTINNIIGSGNHIVYRIDSRHEESDSALARERELIQSMDGLTNKAMNPHEQVPSSFIWLLSRILLSPTVELIADFYARYPARAMARVPNNSIVRLWTLPARALKRALEVESETQAESMT